MHTYSLTKMYLYITWTTENSDHNSVALKTSEHILHKYEALTFRNMIM